MNRIPYCTLEDVKYAADVKDNSRDDQIVRAICGAADSVEARTRRKFYPFTGTRYFDWPTGQYSRSWRLWLDEHTVISVSSISLRGTSTTIDTGYYLLEPVNSGPPYSRIEVDITVGGATATFGGSGGTQRAIVVEGVWGYDDQQADAGTITQDVSGSTGSTAWRVSNSAAVGVGSLVVCEDERALVTAKQFLDTGVALAAELTAYNNSVLLTVDTSGAFSVGEVVMVGSERMLVTAVSGTSVWVQRAQDGTPLAAHAVSDPVYAARLLTVKRGQAGTTAAGHTAGTAITTQVYPGLIQQLAVAEAMVSLEQEKAAYGRVIGSGDNQRESAGKGLDKLRYQTDAQYGRNRMQVV